MRRASAAAGSSLFFLLAPGVVAVVLPGLLTRWEVGDWWPPLRVAGAGLLLAGGTWLLQAFVRFVVDGLGTPAPVAAPERLVVSGPYRHVRNPMYVAVLAAVAGQALLFGSVTLLVYAAALAVAFHAFVLGYEEPRLRRRFGADYDAYRAAVSRWVPRLRAWRG